jgi:RimJ/RimL family protein N-acetyltransferase
MPNALDWRVCTASSGSFLRSSWFRQSDVVSSRPPADNSSRWAAKTALENNMEKHTYPDGNNTMTHDVRLRDIIIDDLPIFFEHQIDSDAVEMAASLPRDLDTFEAHWLELLSKELVIKKTILFDDLVAGYIISFVYFGVREVGYWIGKEYWGQGIATRALVEFLDQVPLRPLRASAAKHNRGSSRVLEKCGFRLVGEDKEFSNIGGKVVEGFVFELGMNDEDASR